MLKKERKKLSLDNKKSRQDHMVQQYDQHAFLLIGAMKGTALWVGQKHANPHREAVPDTDNTPPLHLPHTHKLPL